MQNRLVRHQQLRFRDEGGSSQLANPRLHGRLCICGTDHHGNLGAEAAENALGAEVLVDLLLESGMKVGTGQHSETLRVQGRRNAFDRLGEGSGKFQIKTEITHDSGSPNADGKANNANGPPMSHIR